MIMPFLQQELLENSLNIVSIHVGSFPNVQHIQLCRINQWISEEIKPAEIQSLEISPKKINFTEIFFQKSLNIQIFIVHIITLYTKIKFRLHFTTPISFLNCNQ